MRTEPTLLIRIMLSSTVLAAADPLGHRLQQKETEIHRLEEVLAELKERVGRLVEKGSAR